jgi:hypothetical protein
MLAGVAGDLQVAAGTGAASLHRRQRATLTWQEGVAVLVEELGLELFDERGEPDHEAASPVAT